MERVAVQELNTSVTGSFVEEKAETLIESNPSFFNNFTLVIATQLPEQVRQMRVTDEACGG
jgi:amyloid beta precursor protein binding protein 1